MSRRHFAFKLSVEYGKAGWAIRLVEEYGRYIHDDYVPESAAVVAEFTVLFGQLETLIARWYDDMTTWEEQEMLLSMLPAKE